MRTLADNEEGHARGPTRIPRARRSHRRVIPNFVVEIWRRGTCEEFNEPITCTKGTRPALGLCTDGPTGGHGELLARTIMFAENGQITTKGGLLQPAQLLARPLVVTYRQHHEISDLKVST